MCLECKLALTSDNVVNHISTQHRKKGDPRIPKATSKAIREVAAASQIGASYPAWSLEVESDPTKRRTEMAGLDLKTNLYGCPGCGLTLQRRGAVREHLSKLCRGQRYTENSIVSGLTAQTLNAGFTKVNLRVTPRTPDEASPGVPDLLARVQAFDWESRRPAGIPNARMISPLLMRTRWMIHIAPYHGKEADLRKLVADPTEPELDWVHSVVKAYFADVTVLLDATDELVLQKLNSQNPDRECVSGTHHLAPCRH